MKKFVFSVASRATGRLQIKPSGSGDENDANPCGNTTKYPARTRRKQHPLRQEIVI